MGRNGVTKKKRQETTGAGDSDTEAPGTLEMSLQALSLMSDKEGMTAGKLLEIGKSRHNWKIEIRGLQKRLLSLENEGKIRHTAEGKAFLWYLTAPKAKLFSEVSVSESLALNLLGEMQSLLPPEAMSVLESKIRLAQQVIKNRRKQQISSRWSEKIAVRPAGWAPLPPKTDPEVLKKIQTALYREERVWFTYRKRPSTALEKGRTVNPRGLLIKSGEAFFLLADKSPDDPLKWYRVDRIESCEAVAEAAPPRPRFSFLDFVNSGNSEFGPTIRVERFSAWLSDDLADTVREQRWSDNQKLRRSPDGKGWLIEAELTMGWHFRNFCASRGSSMKVLEPPDLVQEVKNRLRNAAALYD